MRLRRNAYRDLPSVPVLPTLFTLGNLVCGFFAIVVAARVDAVGPIDPRDSTNIMFSGWLIFAAMVCDAFDGSLARFSRKVSSFGGQLDSLADVISFGVAPAFLLVKMVPDFTQIHKEAVWVIAASFAVCAALRLARFNAELAGNDDHLHFRGLPSPAAAASLAAFAIMFHALRKAENPLVYADAIDAALQYVLPFYALALAVLMVSRIPYPHLINQLVRGRRGFGHIVGLVFAMVAVMAFRSYALPLLCAAFVLGVPVRFAWQGLVLRKPYNEPLF